MHTWMNKQISSKHCIIPAAGWNKIYLFSKIAANSFPLQALKLTENTVPWNWENEKRHSEEIQTLCTGCSKAEPKSFAPPQTPFPGVRDSQNLISWRWSLRLPTNPVWWGSMHAVSSYHGNRSTNTKTNTPTNRQDRLQYTAPQLACSVMIWQPKVKTVLN